MPRTTWPKVVVTATLVLSVGLLLSGCVATAGTVFVHAAAAARTALASDKPLVGKCWHGSYANDAGAPNWDEGSAVSCSSTHQLYTFAVKQLHSVHKTALFDKKGYVDQAVWDDAFTTCSDAEDAVMPDLDYEVQRIDVETYLPLEPQWSAGARWVRCDVAVLALGSSVAHPTFDKLPSFATLTRMAHQDPGQFDFCVNHAGGGQASPKGSGAVYADCAKNPQWVLKGYEFVESGDGHPYPSPTDFASAYQASCVHPYADPTHVTFVYYPSRSDWAGGDWKLECWVGRA